jgi:hypothetical protein
MSDNKKVGYLAQQGILQSENHGN